MTIEYQHLPGKFPTIYLHNTYAEVVISRYGGQVLSYIPKGAQDLFFVSSKAFYEPGKSIKGGVPICWPWFGADPEDKGRGAHGIARNRLWEEWDYREHEDGATTVVLGLMSTVESRALWQHDFRLSLSIKVGKTISLALTTSNTGNTAFSITQALHSYFAVSNIACTQIVGLEGLRYLDKAEDGNGETKWQEGSLTIDREIDRIYADVPATLTIEDRGMPRTINITTTGSRTAVVWNPWSAIATRMADLNDDDYTRFICVETTNAADDVITLQPGTDHQLMAEIGLA